MRLLQSHFKTPVKSTSKEVRQNGDNGTMNVKSLPLAGYCRVRVVPLQENFHHFLVRWL